jgi:succinate-semialdehyde dehydrogenase / glutarate-semialdehyde dehydrogenase
MVLKSINPFTNELIKEFEEFSDNEVEKVLIQSFEAFNKWKSSSFEYRRALMEKTALMLRNNVGDYAGSITAEMGKPVKESRAEVEKCAWVCEYYAQNAEYFLGAEQIETDADLSYVSFEPLGTILGIMPWNFPFWQVFRFAVPTLMAGNTVLLKHSSSVQICAQKIEGIFAGSGFPSDVFRNLVVGSGKVEKIIRHHCVKAVSLTGSELAGQKAAEAAGSALKKSLLELGGSNPFIVLGDADIPKAVATGIKARFQNAGQSCIAAKRFILDKKISEKFIALFLEGIKKLRTGDPAGEDTDMGPLASIQQAEKVEEQVKRSVEKGAIVITGGIREKAFYSPTVVVDVRPGMPLFDEEVFGPVAPVTVADTIEEAIALANHTNFGLGVSLFTDDLEKANDLVREFHDGAVFINGLVKSDPRLPFGGTKRSGYGRELAVQGIHEFVNVKTVWARKL